MGLVDSAPFPSAVSPEAPKPPKKEKPAPKPLPEYTIEELLEDGELSE